MIKIGINGFGRIGRLALRSIINRPNIQVVAINDLIDIHQLAYLLKFDSVHGRFKGTVTVKKDVLIINDKPIRITSEAKPENIKWDALDVDFVIESTGFFTNKNNAALHIKGGAKKVVISAPSKDVPNFVMGVNHTKLSKNDLIFSNASCTTNCLAPIVKILNDNFEIIEGLVTTVHASTSSQNVVDGFSEKWRRGRAALNNMIPTSTSASETLIKIIPEMEGKILAMAVRVPVVDVSLIDVTVRLKKATSYSEIKAVMKNASKNELKGILGYTEDEVVSQDFVSESRTSVFDANAGMELNENFFKIISWYDNEFGYATKIVDLIEYSDSL
ncbi:MULTISPECIES: type I glyceraldehyde-3-phosphate dehydrogenase [Flavobacteriaceae]|uniref:Glyceraldehyde-3-phosphate dehydrogenase n=2 Tax=Flavobacteriaceae TaxID=49546 RepID=A0A4Y8ANW7_9FLAO|nr:MULTISPECIES: type I glyceraldehyde-3-phosphate dehydrogenase [Flavobacteriaceae]TEW72119.1 type I glyceraldehyde-3-phosphate dehydrogenase [Gramella jeungdoensis]GGK56555.1 glyceraldehyde-3-phosphate dehydrogenase [Lutibacter litoralis]